MKISLTIKRITPLLAFLALGMLAVSSYEDAFGLQGSDQSSSATVETVRTIPGDAEGTFEHFVKICAGDNNRLERPNVIVSSDTEIFREQVFVNIPPNSCTHQGFTVNAEDPSSITVEVINSRNF